MSNKNTPVKQRIRDFQYRAQTQSAAKGSSNADAAGVGRRPITTTSGTSAATPRAVSLRSQALLNTAFTTAHAQSPRTPKITPKSTALNACYTPSSLYRKDAPKSTPCRKKLLQRDAETPNTQRKLVKLSTTTSNDGAETTTTADDAVEDSQMTVAVRVRPLNAAECSRANVTNVVSVQAAKHELTVLAGTSADASAGVRHYFSYDHVFYSSDPDSKQYACQAQVFAGTAAPLIDTAFEGYNACLFAYGQTGSGKSYSMMGIEALDDAALDGDAPHPEAGIIPRFCHALFQRIDAVRERLQVEVEVSYFEIYNEKIHDLLCVPQATATSTATTTPAEPRQALKVREHPIWGPYVVDLSVHCVDSYAALRNWLAVGNSQRATAWTAMNDKSSRSHSIFNIVLNLTDICADTSTSSASSADSAATYNLRQTRRSKISLVDLAGSERINASSACGERIREGVSINKSLLTLGKVIASLADARKCGSGATAHVPYRESVLTWLLRENLGGNSKTVMLATISPASVHVDETLATLRYACKARSIVNRVKVNESPHDKIIRDLRAEVERLKSLRNEYERQRCLTASGGNPAPRKIIIETSTYDDGEVESLRQQLAARERELQRAQKSWMEKLQEAEDHRRSELRLLKRKGLALELTADQQRQACLVNLAADPIFSGTLFYILPPGVVRIGRACTHKQPDIVLDGPLVGTDHCIIERDICNRLFLTHENKDFETYVNGEQLESSVRVQLFHGDRLVIGGLHYFRISNPYCKHSDRNKLVDFELAHKEILQKQEESLRKKLEEEKRVALLSIEQERAANERDYNERLECLEVEQLKFKYKHELLETERQALAQENALSHTNSSVRATPTKCTKSTLLEDINRIMLQPSEDSLHKTQLMIKEAAQYCRKYAPNCEFQQSQVIDDFGLMRTVALIVDRDRKLKAEWPIARLNVWLDMLRACIEENQPLSADNIFQSVDMDWKPLEAADLNSSQAEPRRSYGFRFSMNVNAFKDAVFKRIRTSFDGNSSAVDSTVVDARKALTFDDSMEPLQPRALEQLTTAALQELDTMQSSAQRLRQLCVKVKQNQENCTAADTQLACQLRSALNQLEAIFEKMSQNIVEHKGTSGGKSSI